MVALRITIDDTPGTLDVCLTTHVHDDRKEDLSIVNMLFAHGVRHATGQQR